MKRDIYKVLIEWKNTFNRRPLLIRGARQTGKTYIVNEFGANEFEHIIYLNFERNPEFKDIFSTFIPSDISPLIPKQNCFTGAEARKTVLPKSII